VRGLSPYPAAWTHHGGRVLKVFKTRLLNQPAHLPPGTVNVGAQSLSVATTDTMLELLELQQEGHRRMGIAEFLRGYKLETGEKFA
jgi:methionyl-tRNA formyltransferase